MVATRDIQPTNFVVNNEVKHPGYAEAGCNCFLISNKASFIKKKKVWLVELLLGDKPGREY
jgi:hypothetical protein